LSRLNNSNSIYFFEPMPNPALGRGLDALLMRKKPASSLTVSEEHVAIQSLSDSDGVVRLPVGVIQTNEFQPRSDFNQQHLQELADSIKEYGIIQPLVVTKDGDTYRLIAGERRLRAAKQLGMEMVPVVFRDADEHQRLAIAIIENVQRVDLNPMECAIAYKRLKDEFNLTQEEIAQRLGKSRPVVANTLRFLNLPSDIQEGLRAGHITEGHGKLLMGLSREEDQLRLFRHIREKNMNIRETVHELQSLGGTKMQRNFIERDPSFNAKEELLRECLGTRVSIVSRGEKGTIEIEFHSLDQLKELINSLINN